MSMPTTACCRKCGYALAGISANQCPECGTTFDSSNKKSFDRSPGARAWRRRWRPSLIVLAIVALVYGAAPRGYVKGVLVYVPGGGEPQTRTALWRLAPPRWISRAPYPRWSSTESGGQYLANPSFEELAGQIRRYEVLTHRVHWFGDVTHRNSTSAWQAIAEIPPGGNPTLEMGHARAMLDAAVRRQARGTDAVWSIPDDAAYPGPWPVDPW